MGIGPAASNQIPVPAQQRVGLHEERATFGAGEQPAETGEERTIWWSGRRPGNLTTQDRHLVAEHDDLDCKIVGVRPLKTEELERADEGDKEERKSHEPVSRPSSS